jgi:putative peptidoglycan lipid II flippase
VNSGRATGRKLTPTALLVTLALGVGSLLPILRDALVASRLGATAASDAYFLSTYVMLLVVTILVYESAVPATVVTLSTPEQGRPGRRWSFGKALLVSGTMLAVLAAAIVLLARPLVRLLAPGFDPGTVDIAVEATRAIAPGIALLGMAGLVGAYLNALDRFVLPALLTPVIALGAILPLLGDTRDPVVAAFGWTIGAGLALAMVLVWTAVVTRRQGHRLREQQVSLGQFRRMIGLAWPLILLTVVTQAAEIADRVISSGLGAGALTNITLAKKTIILPNTIFVAAVGAVALPFVSRQERGRARADALSQTVNLAIFLLLPATILLVLARLELVQILYGRGEFSPADVSLTADLLGIYAFALLPVSLGVILQRAFGAIDASRAPLPPYALAIGGYVLVAWIGTRAAGLVALPLAFAVAEYLYVGTLLVLLRRRHHLHFASLAWPAMVALVATLVAAAGVGLVRLAPVENPWLSLGSMTLAATGLYLATVLWLRHPSALEMLQFVRAPEEAESLARLRVAIDATYAATLNGTGRYLSSLIRELRERPDVEVLAFRAPRVEWLPRPLRRPINGLLHLLWLQIVFPIWAWRQQVDIIHVSMTAPLAAPCPVVVTIHDGLDFHREWRPSMLWSSYVRSFGVWAARRAAVVVTVSHSAALEVGRLFKIPPERLRPIWNGSDIASLTSDEPAERPNAPYLLMVGAVGRRKNVTAAVGAVERLRSGGHDIELVIVGQVPNALKDGRRWLRSVTKVSDASLAWWYRNAAALIHPSRHEGFGLPVLEALSLGVPVVASDIPALREVGGDAARYASPDHPEEFSAAVEFILADPAAERWRIAAASQAARSFTWERAAESVCAVYREALETAGEERAWQTTVAS